MKSDDVKASAGLRVPVVAISGVGHMHAKGEDEQEAARVFYVAVIRAPQRLVIGVKGNGLFHSRLSSPLETIYKEATR